MEFVQSEQRADQSSNYKNEMLTKIVKILLMEPDLRNKYNGF